MARRPVLLLWWPTFLREAEALCHGKRDGQCMEGREAALKTLWESFDQPCRRRLKPSIEEELGRLCAYVMLEVDEEAARQLQQAFPATSSR